MLSKKSMRDEVPNNVEQNGVAIDFDGDGLKAYMFFVTLANIQGDGIEAFRGWPQFDWDGDWEVQTGKIRWLLGLRVLNTLGCGFNEKC